MRKRISFTLTSTFIVCFTSCVSVNPSKSCIHSFWLLSFPLTAALYMPYMTSPVLSNAHFFRSRRTASSNPCRSFQRESDLGVTPHSCEKSSSVSMPNLSFCGEGSANHKINSSYMDCIFSFLFDFRTVVVMASCHFLLILLYNITFVSVSSPP